MAGSYERTSSLWKVSKQIHGVKRSSGISLHCLILCALFCHYCWTFKCRPIDNVERAIGKIPHLLIKTCAKWTRYLRLLATNPRCVCVCVCVCVLGNAGRESSADSFLSDIPFKQCPSPSCSKLCFSETHLGKSINCFFFAGTDLLAL